MKLLSLIATLIISFGAFNQSYFKRLGDWNQDDEGKAIIECSNSELVLGGVTTYGAGGTDIFLSRLTSNGQILWSNTYGLSSDESGAPFSLYETSNGDLLCSFRSESLGQSRAAVLMRLDQNGNILWQKMLTTGSNSEWTRTIFEHDDGSIYVGATVNAQLFGSSDAVLTKLDPNGNLIWSKTFGMPGNDHIWSMVPLPNDEILLNMNSEALGPGNRSSILVKVDANGNMLSQVAYGGSGLELCSDVVYDPNVGYLVGGGTTSYGQGGRDAFVALFDQNFTLQWFKTFGGPIFDHGTTVEIIDNNHFVMYMNSDLSGSGDKQLSIVGVDANGTTLYNKTVGGGLDDYLTNNSSSAMVHSSNLSRTYLTGAYTETNFDVQAIVMALDGSPQSLCSDTLISEGTHTPTVTNVNFNEANLGSMQNINLSTTTYATSIFDYCPCPLTPPVLNDTTICSGTTLSYSLDPSYNYEWSPSSEFTCATCPDPDFIGSDTTQVKVVFDNGTCMDSVSFDINVNLSGTANVSGPDTICESSSSVILTSNQSGLWSGNGIVDAVTGEFDPMGLSGDIELIFEANSPCVENDTLSVFVESLIVADITSSMDTLCFNTDIDTLVNLGATPTSGYWSGSAVYDSVNGYLDENFINAGPQEIFYTPYGACVQSDSLMLDIVQTAESSILYQDTLCASDNVVDLDNTGGYAGTWQGNGITDSNQGLFDPSQANSGTNSIVFIPGNQCIINDTVDVVVESAVNASITSSIDTLCFNVNTDTLVSLSATPNNGYWSGTPVVDSVNGYLDEGLINAGPQMIYYTPYGTCVVADSILIDLVAVDTADIVYQDTLCELDNMVNLDIQNGYDGSWFGNGIVDANTGSFDPALAAAGNNTIVFNPDNQCVDNDTIHIHVESTVSAQIESNDTIMCVTDEALMLNAAPFNGNWSGFADSTVNGNTFFSPFQNGTGTFTIYYTPTGNCVISDSIIISVNDLNVNVQDSITLCQNVEGEIEYSPSGGNWYGQYAGDVINGTSVDPLSLSPGVYEYIYEVDNGCVDSDTLVLTVLNTPNADLGNDTTICYDCELDLSPEIVSADDSIYWSTGSTDQSITVENEGSYSIFVENELGCSDSASISIGMFCDASLFIPNSFTPDDSGLNDILEVYGENITIKSFEIYNRWGNRIHSANNEPFSWDGTYQSNKVKDGVYIYKISFYECDSEKVITKVGHIVLIK